MKRLTNHRAGGSKALGPQLSKRKIMSRQKHGPCRGILFFCLSVFLSSISHAAEVLMDPQTPLIGGAESWEGRDLDLGFHDFIDVSLAAPASGDIVVRYVCEGAPGTGREQSITVAQDQLKAARSFRIDMGAEIGWRGKLKSLRCDVPAKLSVGDGEGVEYVTLPMEDEWTGMKQAESKHFRIVWGTELSKDFTAEQARGTLRNFEEAWQFLVKVMKLKKPYSIEGEPGRYRKVNITTHRGGFESGGGTVSMDPSGLRVDPPSWVIPHELMHTFQEVQGGKMAGMWCESHADYAIERWLRHVRPLFDGTEEVAAGEPTCFNPNFATMAHWYLAHGRDYYLCWPIWAYLDENPDELPGLGGGAMSSRLWQEIREHEDLFAAVHRLTDADVPTLIGHYARRNVTWHYANGAAMRRVFTDYLRDEPRQRSLVYADLVARPDAPGWWRPETQRAPQPGGYTQHELELPKSHSMTVDLRPLNGAVRASLVAMNADGSEAAFAGPFASGQMSLDVPRSARRLVLVVAATPENFEHWTEDEMLFSMRTHPMRQRHHYVVKLTGTEPLRVKEKLDGGKRHPNGGGFVADTAQVARTAFVGPDAVILDEAKVEGDAIIDGHATIQGKAVIRDEARVLGPALIENAMISDHATVTGQCHVWRDEENTLSGDAVLAVDYGGGRAVSNGFQTGFVGWVACPQEWIDARTAPKHRWVNYEFAQAHHNIITDSPGFTDAFVIGRPAWADGAIHFDGKTQGLLLDRDTINLRRATISVRVKWAGGSPMQPVWHFSRGEDFIQLTPSNLSGHLALQGRCGGKTFTAGAAGPLPTQAWTTVTVTLDGENLTLSRNGKIEAHAALKATPHDFAGEASYLARSEKAWFAGAMDDFRVWSNLAEKRPNDE